jgi:hypothetical protein
MCATLELAGRQYKFEVDEKAFVERYVSEKGKPNTTQELIIFSRVLERFTRSWWQNPKNHTAMCECGFCRV